MTDTMTEFAAARFPVLAPQEPAPRAARAGLQLTMGLLPLPVGEVSVLLTAWLLILPV